MSFSHPFQFESSSEQQNRPNMENSINYRPDVEDVAMKDAGLDSNELPMITREGNIGSMHTSAPVMEGFHTPQPPQPSQPSQFFSLNSDEKNNFDPWLGPSSFLKNPPPLPTLLVRQMEKLPAIRPTFRFSPKGYRKSTQIPNHGMDILRPNDFQIQAPYNPSYKSTQVYNSGIAGSRNNEFGIRKTYNSFGKSTQNPGSGIAVSRNNEFGTRKPVNSPRKSLSHAPTYLNTPSFAYKPTIQPGVIRPAMSGLSSHGPSVFDHPRQANKPLLPLFQRANTSRDSSFSSFDSQKSTEDGKANSFDSLTSVSTNQSSLSRKRSIDDEVKKSHSPVAAAKETPSPFTKYRRLSADGLGIPTGNIEVPDTGLGKPASPLSPSQRILTPKSPTKLSTPTRSLSSASNFMEIDSPTRKGRDAQQTTCDTNSHMPGCWPTPPELHAKSDQDIQMEGAMMSGALLPTSTDDPLNGTSSHKPSAEERNLMDTEHDSNEHMIPVPDAQAPVSAWHTYYASLYASLQTVFQNRIVQTVATAFREAVAYAGSLGANALGLLERQGRPPVRRTSPTARHSPIRANIRTMPVEQQQRLKANQWRKDRGLPIADELPFPKISFDSPHIAPSPPHVYLPETVDHPDEEVLESAITAVAESVMQFSRTLVADETGHHSNEGTFEPTTAPTPTEENGQHASERVSPQTPIHKAKSVAKFTPTSILKQKRSGPASGVRKKSRLGPLSATAQARLLGNRKARGRMELALRDGLKSGNFEKMEKVIEELETDTDQLPLARRPLSAKSKSVRFREPLVTPSSRERRPALRTELAPHLRPSPLDTEQTTAIGKPLIEQKENIPLSSVISLEPVGEATTREDVETTEPESPVDPWCRPPEFPLGRPVSAVSLFAPIPRPLPPGRTESIYAEEFRKMEEQKKLEERPSRIRPEGSAVRPLPPKWKTRLEEAMRLPPNRKIVDTLSGDALTKRDLETCFTPMKWLNDEVINSYLALIVDYLRRTNGNAGRHDKPRFHAFNSFFFSNLRDKGYDSVRRWASRAKIGGKDLLNVDTVFVPVHNSMHWTLIVVKPSDRTIENFDSLGSLSPRHVAIIKTWLRGELGDKYVDVDWTVLESASPQQDNGSDCGVFLLSTAKAVAFHIEPMSYGANDTTLLRKKIVAELMNGGFEGDFDPTDAGGDTLL